MADRKHSPRPWKLRRESGGWTISGDKEKSVAGPFEASTEDARIMGAGSAMLAALEHVVRYNQGRSDCPWEVVEEQVLAAIALATEMEPASEG